jgi:hypothetical protein
MSDISLLSKRKFVVTNDITVHIPTIREIRGNDDEPSKQADYWSVVNMFAATSCDIMIELDEQGIDFTKWSDFNTFLMMFNGVSKDTLHEMSPLLFDNVDLSTFVIKENANKTHLLLADTNSETTIDELVYMRLSTIFCTINNMKKNHRKMGNEVMRKYAIERAKAHRQNAKRAKQEAESYFDKQIVAMVNNRDFKYDFETVNNLTIYDFNVSLKQLTKNKAVDNLYRGIYAGTIKYTAEYNNKLNWLDYES